MVDRTPTGSALAAGPRAPEFTLASILRALDTMRSTVG